MTKIDNIQALTNPAAMTTRKTKAVKFLQLTRSGSKGRVTFVKVPRRSSTAPAQLHNDDQAKATQNPSHRPVAKQTIPTPKTPDGVAPQPTPENAQPVENGGNTSPASEAVVTTMPGSAKPIPGNPVPPAAATSELSATTYGTQNGTTVEVVGENATAHAAAATVRLARAMAGLNASRPVLSTIGSSGVCASTTMEKSND
jgi:hypothetical protein